MNAQAHDLLRIPADSLCAFIEPRWLKEVLRRCPWVVVRRDRSPEGLVPVGIRGVDRNQRWGALVMQESIEEIIRPEDTRRRSATRTPALAALRELREKWSGMALTWGPAGSVGFELATGQYVTTEASDLDIVIRAESPIAREDALVLYDRAADLAVRVDVRV